MVSRLVLHPVRVKACLNDTFHKFELSSVWIKPRMALVLSWTDAHTRMWIIFAQSF